MVNRLVACIGKVEKLSLTVYPETYQFLRLRLASVTAPRLKALRLNIWERDSIEPHAASQAALRGVRLTSHPLLDAPSLTDFSIQICQVLPGKLKIHPDINSLSLRLGCDGLGPEEPHDPSLIFGTIQAHEKLTQLLLNIHGAIQLREYDTIVQLSRLKCLSLSVWGFEHARYILSRMEIPEIVQLDLSMRLNHTASPATIGSYLANVMAYFPPKFLWIPTDAVLDPRSSGIILHLKEHSSSKPTVVIALNFSITTIDLKEIDFEDIAQPLIKVFPRLRMWRTAAEALWTRRWQLSFGGNAE